MFNSFRVNLTLSLRKKNNNNLVCLINTPLWAVFLSTLFRFMAWYISKVTYKTRLASWWRKNGRTEKINFHVVTFWFRQWLKSWDTTWTNKVKNISLHVYTDSTSLHNFIFFLIIPQNYTHEKSHLLSWQKLFSLRHFIFRRTFAFFAFTFCAA